MAKKPKADPPFHRLTIDLDKTVYTTLKVLADSLERSPSKQAKVMLVELLQKNTRKST